ncbi:Integral membrane protein [Streptomyces venezuelae]|uniref:acyltransferase family protein n=1 Tax=Streptomyces gardneri TaxID=66892 RepID=UPI0006BDC2AB|nr:acyltransferase [Streptomyces gardneri]ALO08076.1 Integral membrane protein [Streptomyces venezuelae]QPK45347.1 acyltransferase [Streptomyces gardneri]WRK36670.1 acyltransferase [Streptomyces venezuelae]CUM41577.1 putative membrane protein [Streptomyces venezuelae]
MSALATTARRTAAKIESSTPAHRDRAIDGLRALALLAVPTGHWLLGGFTLSADGALHNASPLGTFAGLAPVSWVLQMLGIFFLVGGYASVLSYRRRKGSTGEWLKGRLARLGRPVLGVTAVWAALLPLLHFGLGVPVDSLRTASTLVVQPLWFVGVYTVVTALTPYCVRVARRLGVWAAAPLLGSVAVVDFLRYGPYADAVPSWLSLLNILPGWLFAYQLGVSWGEGRVTRKHAWALLLGGAALFATLLLAFGYPASMVGVPGEARTNSHPPSLLVLALAAAQSGAAILLRDRLGRLLKRPALWAPVVVVNLSAMTILCWHQTAMLTAAIPGSYLGEIPGLVGAPDSVGWILARLAWMPVFAGLLVLIGRFARGFESPWTKTGPARRALAGLLAAGFGVFALGLG